MECSICKRTFTRKDNLNRHIRGHNEESKHQCEKCGKRFKRKDDRIHHERNCGKVVHAGSGIQPPRQRHPTADQNKFTISKVKTAFSNATITWKLHYPKNDGYDYVSLINSSTQSMTNHLEQYRTENHALKFNMAIHMNFEQSVDCTIVTDPPVVLVTEQFEAYMTDDIPYLLKEASKQLENRIETYEGTGSGWIVSNLISLDTTVWCLDPLRASSYHPLPKWIQNTHCVLNIRNNDQKCFKYAVLAGLYKPSKSKKADHISSYKYTESLTDTPDFRMLTFPTSLKEINKFEKANNISVNVYSIDEKKNKNGCETTTDGKSKDKKSGVQKRKNRTKNQRSKRIKISTFIDDEVECCDDNQDESDEEQCVIMYYAINRQIKNEVESE